MNNCRFFFEKLDVWFSKALHRVVQLLATKRNGGKLKAFHFKYICELLCNENLQNATLNYAMTKTIYVQKDNIKIIKLNINYK